MDFIFHLFSAPECPCLGSVSLEKAQEALLEGVCGGGCIPKSGRREGAEISQMINHICLSVPIWFHFLIISF